MDHAIDPDSAIPDIRPWVGIAANAHSGLGRGRRRVGRLVAALEALGLAARVAWTLPERAELVARAREESGCRCLVAAGGDGTVGAVLNEWPGVPVTALPVGTENLFARHFGLPARPEALAALIARGRTARIDLGQVDGRRFALMAGIGFDADVVTRHHRARLRGAGVPRPTHRAAYVAPVLRASLSYRFPPLSVRIADPGHEEELTGTTAFLFNLPRYALGLPFAPLARPDDGLLDVVVFRNPGAIQALRYLWLVLRRLHLRRSGIYHRQARRVTVTAAEPVPVQLDGDPGGEVPAHDAGTPWSVAVEPGAVEVLVPDSYHRADAP